MICTRITASSLPEQSRFQPALRLRLLRWRFRNRGTCPWRAPAEFRPISAPDRSRNSRQAAEVRPRFLGSSKYGGTPMSPRKSRWGRRHHGFDNGSSSSSLFTPHFAASGRASLRSGRARLVTIFRKRRLHSIDCLLPISRPLDSSGVPTRYCPRSRCGRTLGRSRGLVFLQLADHVPAPSTTGSLGQLRLPLLHAIFAEMADSGVISRADCSAGKFLETATSVISASNVLPGPPQPIRSRTFARFSAMSPVIQARARILARHGIACAVPTPTLNVISGAVLRD